MSGAGMEGLLIRRLCVIGVGLIGGSLARALRKAGVVGEIVGSDHQEAQLQQAVELGVIDRYDSDPGRAVEGADLVVASVPLGAMLEVFGAIAGHLAPGAVVTDVGSAKGSVLGDIRRIFGDSPGSFVPGHPIAGTERSGVEHSFAELFENRRVILCPLLETQSDAHDKVRRMWQAAGAEVVDIGVRHHDEVLAATSHLPHMLAYALVDCLARLDDRAEIFRYAAGGFRDFTRIASSNPDMWHDICLSNREPLLKVLEVFRNDLDRLVTAIQASDSETILTIFRRAKHARDNLYLK